MLKHGLVISMADEEEQLNRDAETSAAQEEDDQRQADINMMANGGADYQAQIDAVAIQREEEAREFQRRKRTAAFDAEEIADERDDVPSGFDAFASVRGRGNDMILQSPQADGGISSSLPIGSPIKDSDYDYESWKNLKPIVINKETGVVSASDTSSGMKQYYNPETVAINGRQELKPLLGTSLSAFSSDDTGYVEARQMINPISFFSSAPQAERYTPSIWGGSNINTGKFNIGNTLFGNSVNVNNGKKGKPPAFDVFGGLKKNGNAPSFVEGLMQPKTKTKSPVRINKQSFKIDLFAGLTKPTEKKQRVVGKPPSPQSLLTASVIGGSPLFVPTQQQQEDAKRFVKEKAKIEAAALQAKKTMGRKAKEPISEPTPKEESFLYVKTGLPVTSRHIKAKVSKDGKGVVADKFTNLGTALEKAKQEFDPTARAQRKVLKLTPEEEAYFPQGVPAKGVTQSELTAQIKKYESKERRLAESFPRAEKAFEKDADARRARIASAAKRLGIKQRNEFIAADEAKKREPIEAARLAKKAADAQKKEDKNLQRILDAGFEQSRQTKIAQLKTSTKKYWDTTRDLDAKLAGVFGESEKTRATERAEFKKQTVTRLVDAMKFHREESARKEDYMKNKATMHERVFGFGTREPWNEEYNKKIEDRLYANRSDADKPEIKLGNGVILSAVENLIVRGATNQVKKYHADLLQGRADRAALLAQQRSWFYGGGLQPTKGTKGHPSHFPHKSGRPAKPRRSPLGGTELAFFGKPFGAPKRLKRSRRGRILKGTRAAARRKEARRPKNFLDNVFGAW